MTKLTKTLYTLIFSVVLQVGSTHANNQNSSFAFNKLTESLCESAETDQLIQLKRSLRQAKSHIRAIYPDVQCEGQSLLSLAVSNQSERVINYLKLRAKPETVTKARQLLTSK